MFFSRGSKGKEKAAGLHESLLSGEEVVTLDKQKQILHIQKNSLEKNLAESQGEAKKNIALQVEEIKKQIMRLESMSAQKPLTDSYAPPALGL